MRAPLRLLAGVDAAAVLVEVAYLSNPGQAAAAGTAEFQDAVSELSSLAEIAPPDKMLAVQAQYGTALYKVRRRDDAWRLFENKPCWLAVNRLLTICL